MKKSIATLFLLVTASAQANAGWFGPSTYEECIQEKLKGVTSDTGARLIAIACRKQFPDKSQPKPSPVLVVPAPASPANYSNLVPIDLYKD